MKTVIKMIIFAVALSCCEEEQGDFGVGTIVHIDGIKSEIGFDIYNTIPDMDLRNSDDGRIQISDYKKDGIDYLIIDFSFKNCGPCIKLGEYHQQILQRLRDDGMSVEWVTVLDPVAKTTLSDVEEWQSRTGGNTLLDDGCKYCEDGRLYPLLILVDFENSRVEYRENGFLDPKKYPNSLDYLIDEILNS